MNNHKTDAWGVKQGSLPSSLKTGAKVFAVFMAFTVTCCIITPLFSAILFAYLYVAFERKSGAVNHDDQKGNQPQQGVCRG